MLFVSNYVIFRIIELAKSNFYYLKVLLSGKYFLFLYLRRLLNDPFLREGDDCPSKESMKNAFSF